MICRVVVALLLVGCTVPRGAGFSDVQTLVRDHGVGRIHWNTGTDEDRQVAERIRALLKQPLTQKSATEIALLNNPKLQATYERLGIAQADLVQAGLLKNPSLSLGAAFPLTAGLNEYEGSLITDFLDLFLIPLRKRFARAELESVKLEVADAVLELQLTLRTAFYTVQAGQQLVALQREVFDAARAALDLAQRQYSAGNINELEVTTYQISFDQAQLELAHAETMLLGQGEQLTRTLGVWGLQTDWQIAAPLSELPKDEPAPEQIESFAIAHRLDLAAARSRLKSWAAALGLTNAGLIGGLEVGVQAHQDPDAGTRLLGPTLRLELPIFDQRQATRAKLRAQLRQSQRAIESLAIEIRSAVRVARTRMTASRRIVDYYKSTALKSREQLVALSQLQYNGMQIGLFQLLQAKQSQINGYREYIDTIRDYWIAHAELERAAGGPIAQPAEAGAQPHTHRESQ